MLLDIEILRYIIMIGYKIITKYSTNDKLVIYPVPKNANTSIKMFLAQHLNLHKKYEYREDIPRYKRKMEKDYSIPSICSFLPNYIKFQKVDANIRICIVREPVKRFISTYQNRILFHRDPKFYGLSVDQVIENLKKNNFENRHFLPQSYFLGDKLNYFTNIYKINEINLFTRDLNEFFGKELQFPHLQTGKTKHIKLTSNQIEQIKEIYIEDYELFKNFNFDF